MNKTELIAAVAEKTGLSKKDTEAAVNATLLTITETLKAEEKVQLVGFGSFETKKRAARTGLNPRTKETVEIPLVYTVVSEQADVAGKLAAGVDFLNVSGAARTPEIVAHIREKFPEVPIIATGGPTDDTIRATIGAGANAITYTPPTSAELFAESMRKYRGKFA